MRGSTPPPSATPFFTNDMFPLGIPGFESDADSKRGSPTSNVTLSFTGGAISGATVGEGWDKMGGEIRRKLRFEMCVSSLSDRQREASSIT